MWRSLQGGRARQRFLRNRGAVLGAILVGGLVVFALVGPSLSPHGPFTSVFDGGVGENEVPVGPSAKFLLGADVLFRDLFVRLAYGARLSLTIALFATLIATIIGAGVGIVAGYTEGDEGMRVPWASALIVGASLVAEATGHTGYIFVGLLLGLVAIGLARSGWAKRTPLLRSGFRLNLDTVLMRGVDVGLSFPFLLLVMAIGAALERTTPGTILAVLGLTGWLGTARIIRSKALVLRRLDFVVASRALGQSTLGILVRHIAPNVAGPVIVLATLTVAQMIIAESVLSYLGVGVSPPTATWGQMLFEGQERYAVSPWMLVAPAAAILMAGLGFNLLGEGLRDALDPQDE